MISVAMATFNGKKFLTEQVESILKQLGKEDELVVSDDGSTDGTVEILKKFKDERIKILNGPRKGIKKNFENAIRKCRGEIIFLADQDDVWKEGKVRKVLAAFGKDKVMCVVHDCEVFDSEGGKTIYPSFFEWRGSRAGKLKNIWKNSYIGCCMAFRAEMKKYILPIPDNIEMHDQWVGILSEEYGRSVFLRENLLKYRRHGENSSEMEHYPLPKMIENRVRLVKELRKRLKGGRSLGAEGERTMDERKSRGGERATDEQKGKKGEVARSDNGKTKILALYLPAFHQVKENDEWWGEGFTEWNNVKSGKKYFKGHTQPVHPLDGYYDLAKAEEVEKQLKMAKEYGVYGFICYHYWFGGGRKLLEKPVEIIRDKTKTDLKYCLCWANESWITTWHGNDPKDLILQEYPGRKDWEAHLEYLLTFFKDERYIKIDEKPVMFIYKANEIPDYEEMLAYFDERLRGEGFGGFYAVEYISSKNRELASEKSAGVVEFEPLYTTFFDISKLKLLKRVVAKKLRRIDFQDYDYLWDKIIRRKRTYLGKPIFRGGFVGWDNSPRKEKNSMIVRGGSAEAFEANLRSLVETKRPDANEFVVLNAWNEWSEGAFLEPSEEWGYDYLEALRRVA